MVRLKVLVCAVFVSISEIAVCTKPLARRTLRVACLQLRSLPGTVQPAFNIVTGHKV